MKKRTPEEQRIYMQEYRARKKAEEDRIRDAVAPAYISPKLVPDPVVEVKAWLAELKEKAPSKPSGYQCGCTPDQKCMSHAIQAMSQKRRDEILNAMNLKARK